MQATSATDRQWSVSLALTVAARPPWNVAGANGFNIIWSSFGWSNQTLAVFTLWVAPVYLAKERKPYVVTLLSALFMPTVCVTFICGAGIGFGLDWGIAYAIGLAGLLAARVWFVWWKRKH
ncbi:MAG: hypothetical protein IJ722_05275 [Alloprevotella sp.]|nr:hypothetical protein [Prevotella sp.]MBR1712795.1 hypothetical protein [Alloprevotella sp.]